MASDTPQPPPGPLVPPPAAAKTPSRTVSDLQRNLLIGAALGGVLLLMLSCCCCGGCTLFRGGRGLGSGNSRLVGTWKGKDTFGFGIDFEINLKANGRYEYDFKGPLIGGGTATGEWRVKLIEDERYILDTINDGVPDETIGWTVIFEESDQILLQQPNGDSWRLKRQ